MFVLFPCLAAGAAVLWVVVARITHKASIASIT